MYCRDGAALELHGHVCMIAWRRVVPELQYYQGGSKYDVLQLRHDPQPAGRSQSSAVTRITPHQHQNQHQHITTISFCISQLGTQSCSIVLAIP
jgi:hypothetical protein